MRCPRTCRLVSSGAGLGLGFLVSCCWPGCRARRARGRSSSRRPNNGIPPRQRHLGSKLGWQLAAFRCRLVLHVLVGLIAFMLARLTELAFPVCDWTPALANLGWFVVLAGLVIAANTTWYPASHFAGDSSAASAAWRALIRVARRSRPWRAGLFLLARLLRLRCEAKLQWPPSRASPLLVCLYAVIPKLGNVAVRRVQAPEHRNHRHRCTAP